MSTELQACLPLLRTLVDTAEPDDGRWSWTGDVTGMVGGQAVRVNRRLDDSLIGGRSGIALALAAGARALRAAGIRPADPWRIPPDELASQVARDCLERVSRIAPATRGVPIAPATPVTPDVPVRSHHSHDSHGSAPTERLGVITGVAMTARLLEDDALTAAARSCAGTAVRGLAADPQDVPQTPDLFGGTAGQLLEVLGAELPSEVEELRRTVADTLSARLMADAVRDALGTRWNSRGAGGPVVGLAHGASGPALALAEWAAFAARQAAEGDQRGDQGDQGEGEDGSPGKADGGGGGTHSGDGGADGRGGGAGGGTHSGGGDPDRIGAAWSTVLDAMRWESAWYDEQLRQWRDPRGTQEPISWWCHGAAGLGIAAARIRRLATARGRPEVAQLASVVLRRALRATALTWSAPVPITMDGRIDGTLCHGLAGAVESVQVAAALTGDPTGEHTRAARCLARPLLRPGIDGRAWSCGAIGGGRSPSLFTGLSGVVVTLVRLHDRRLAPSPALPGPVFGAGGVD